MQSVQRQFGKLLNKSPGDNAKISALLSDYEDADRILAKIIDHAKAWREAWTSLSRSQLAIVTEYEGLYDPIVGAADGHGRPSVPTPELQLSRTLRLKEAYNELNSDLAEEIVSIESRIVKPCADARDCIAPLRKTIKKRENRRLDYERCQDKASKLQKKSSRTPKEDAALAKAENEVALAAEEFNMADSHLRQTLPPVVVAVFSLIPHLICSMIMIQNHLLGLYYTILHGYCEENGFPSPPPPMEEVIAEWQSKQSPVLRELEAIGCVARGKSVLKPMGSNLIEEMPRHGRQSSTSSASSYGPQNGYRRSSSGLIPTITSTEDDSPEQGPSRPPRPNRIPSTTTVRAISPGAGSLRGHSPASSAGSRTPSFSGPSYTASTAANDLLTPTAFTTASRLASSLGSNSNLTQPRTDYCQGRDNVSFKPTTASTLLTSSQVSSLVAGKKKAPPPPPPKRAARPLEEFVVAQFDFAGQGAGDLSFREGDRIKIIEKTATDQDWWVGETGGVKGNFPANYCKAA